MDVLAVGPLPRIEGAALDAGGPPVAAPTPSDGAAPIPPPTGPALLNKLPDPVPPPKGPLPPKKPVEPLPFAAAVTPGPPPAPPPLLVPVLPNKLPPAPPPPPKKPPAAPGALVAPVVWLVVVVVVGIVLGTRNDALRLLRLGVERAAKGEALPGALATEGVLVGVTKLAAVA